MGLMLALALGVCNSKRIIKRKYMKQNAGIGFLITQQRRMSWIEWRTSTAKFGKTNASLFSVSTERGKKKKPNHLLQISRLLQKSNALFFFFFVSSLVFSS